MNKIVKVLDAEYSTNDIERGGLSSYISWNSLRALLEKTVRAGDNEKIIGIVADEDGLLIGIKRK